MSKGHKFTNATDAYDFIHAGNATVTLVSLKTSTRYTYRVRASKDGKVNFVFVMYGNDNESDYVYIGIIRGTTFMRTAKSKIPVNDVRLNAFAWVHAQLADGQLPETLQVWHEGKCGRCGHKLTVPESIERGIGPECIKHHHPQQIEMT